MTIVMQIEVAISPWFPRVEWRRDRRALLRTTRFAGTHGCVFLQVAARNGGDEGPGENDYCAAAENVAFLRPRCNPGRTML